MFIACPHCHELVAIHPPSRQPPELCPRCGGALRMPANEESPAPAMPVTPSFASLLRGSETPAADPPPSLPPAPAATLIEPTTDAQPESPADVAPPPAAMADAPAVVSVDNASEPGAAPEAEAERKSQSPPPATGTDADTDADADTVAGGAAAADEPTTSASESTPTPAFSEESAAPSLAVSPVARQPVSRGGGPSFIHRQRTAQVQTGAGKGQWWLLAALSLLLVIQVLLADRARLAMDAGWRPLLMSICDVLRCSLPPWREPEAFVMLNRDVRPVADTPGTLQAQASFRNDARWPQPWPVLLLTLKDADGRTLGARALLPAEYLDASVDGSEIAAGQSAQVAVRIREPSANVVAYSFDFR